MDFAFFDTGTKVKRIISYVLVIILLYCISLDCTELHSAN